MLYFDNLSPDTGDAYLADGLTEELTAQLGRIERLVVTSRHAVRRYRGRDLGPSELGRALGVAHLVAGSVRRSGNRLRVTVELMRSATGVRLWGEQYDRREANLLAIQEDIARAVTTAIAGRLLPGEHAWLAARPTREPEAYKDFLRGNFELAQRSPRTLARAIAAYEAALRRDPGFTAALARIGLTYALLLEWGWGYEGLPPDRILARGFTAADRALLQDSSAAEAWLARGFLLSIRHPRTLEGVRQGFERALALDPASAEIHHLYAWILSISGEDSAAVAEGLRALALEPNRAITFSDLGQLSYLRGRYDEASQWLDSAVGVEPSFAYPYALRALVRLHEGAVRDARSDAETAARVDPSFRMPGKAALAIVASGAGDTAAARETLPGVLAEVRNPNRPTPIEGLFVSAALAAAGLPDSALAFLERVEPRGAALWFYLRSPDVDPLRHRPRFQRLVEESRPR